MTPSASPAGWDASVYGLGLAQISAPGRVARMIGVDDNEASRNLMVGIGVRELVSGVWHAHA